MRYFPLFFLAIGLVACQPAEQAAEETAPSAPEPTTGGEMVRAKEGETVVMFFTHVKADKRTQFEEFFDFINNTMDRIGAEDPEFARQTGTFRALYPAEPNEDGTLTYVFVGDPLIEGTETGIRPILSRVYSDEEVDQHVQKWTDSLARGQDVYRFVQSKW